MSQPNPANDFQIPNALRFECGPGGLVRCLISTAAADAEIYLHGAHVTHWKPRGQQPVLFLSSKSVFAPGNPIRGGVPVVFPWFGPRGDGQAGPMHGFARISEWAVERTALLDNGGVQIALALSPNDASRGVGFDAFQLRFTVTVGAELEMELEVRNTARESLTYEEALHTYLAVADIHRVSISGLKGSAYIDKTDAFQRKVLGADAMRIAQETNRVHLNTTATCAVEDPVWKRRVSIVKSGSDSTVVWNPWIEQTKRMSDLGPGDWERMLCVETANVAENAVQIAPGASHTMRALIRVEPLGG